MSWDLIIFRLICLYEQSPKSNVLVNPARLNMRGIECPLITRWKLSKAKEINISSWVYHPNWRHRLMSNSLNLIKYLYLNFKFNLYKFFSLAISPNKIVSEDIRFWLKLNWIFTINLNREFQQLNFHFERTMRNNQWCLVDSISNTVKFI
jgi:hypothetical protein